jgi:hypothetical protein
VDKSGEQNGRRNWRPGSISSTSNGGENRVQLREFKGRFRLAFSVARPDHHQFTLMTQRHEVAGGAAGKKDQLTFFTRAVSRETLFEAFRL